MRPLAARLFRRLDAAALALLAAILLFHHLGATSLLGDEAIYAQVERQAATQGTWLPPRYQGALFFAKPPLRDWAVALIFRLVGISSWTARGLDAAMGVATFLLTYLAGRTLFGRRAAAIAVLVLLAAHNLLYVHGLRDGVQESALLFLLSAALLSYLVAATAGAPVGDGMTAAGAVPAAETAGSRRRDRADLVSGLLAATSLLVKNAVGLLVLAVTGLYELIFAPGDRAGDPAPRGWRRLLPRHPLRILAVILAVYLPWLLVAYLASGGRYFHILHTDVVQRLTAGIDPAHVRQGVFLHELAGDFGPALLFVGLAPLVALAAWRARRAERRRSAVPREAGKRAGKGRGGQARPAPAGWRRREPQPEPETDRGRDLERVVFLVLWAGIVLAVLSTSAEKLEWYIYPAYPALALLAGYAADRALAALDRPRPLAWLGTAVVAVYLIAGVLRSWQAGLVVPPLLEGDQLARQLVAAGRPLACLDRRLSFREWNVFYLMPLMKKLVKTPADAAPCELLMTVDPSTFVPPAFPPERIFLFHKFDNTEQDTYAVDLGGRLHLDQIVRRSP